MPFNRRSFLGLTGAAVGSVLGTPAMAQSAATTTRPKSKATPWMMPAEDEPHDRTWMCWPSSKSVWGADLTGVQNTIVDIASAIVEYEPVSMLARPAEVSKVRALLKGVEVIEGTVDDLWARDSLPNFVTRRRADGTVELGAGHARFNGWGGKQISKGDTQLAGLVSKRLQIALLDCGLIGEGGGIETDGAGTILATESCWVNRNRNPRKSRAQIESALLAMLGGRRMLWVDGLAGRDITDGHIDTLARFVNPTTIVVDQPAFTDKSDPWVKVAARTRQQIDQSRTETGGRYKVVELVQPKEVRGNGDEFLSTYMNYYVCNGAVIAPRFGDQRADNAARKILQGLFPKREVVLLDIDPLAAGGGGIHCATQQQPSTRS
jgi:agmatine deiminase